MKEGTGPQTPANPEPDGGTPTTPANDYATGEWRIEPVTSTADTFSHFPAFAFTPSTAWVAFAEPDPNALRGEDIWVGRNDGTGWTFQRMTNAGNVQISYPNLAANGQELTLVYNGYPGGDNDLFAVAYDGSTWGAPVDLTSGYETPQRLGSEYHPVLAVGPSGERAIAYLRQAADVNGVPSGPADVYVLRLEGNGPAAPPDLVAAAPAGSSCYSPDLTFDLAGKLHVVASCGPLRDADIVYASNASGTWTTQVLPGTGGRDDVSPAIVASTVDASIDIVWMHFEPCGSGGQRCSDLWSATLKDGRFSTAAIVLPGGGSKVQPAMAVDASGTTLLAFHRYDATSGKADIFITARRPGGAWLPARNLTPGTESTDEWMPSSLRINPFTGYPELGFERLVGANNGEIYRARWQPTFQP